MRAKVKHKAKLIRYLADPANGFPDRQHYPEILKIRRQTIYHHFSPEELSDIECEALDLRRTKYAPRLSKVDEALLKQAESGDPTAIKLCYQRFEGWNEKHKHEVTGKDGRAIENRYTLFPPQPETVEEWLEMCKTIDQAAEARGEHDNIRAVELKEPDDNLGDG